jgi:DNA-3-methyladenine glycosylase
MAICRSLGPAEIGSLSPVIIGTVLMRYLPEGVASGHIVETEAYVVGGAAGHAYRGMTRHIRSLFLKRGHAYLCRLWQLIHEC